MRTFLSTLFFLIGAAALAGVVWWLRTREVAAEQPPPRPPYSLPVTLAAVELEDLVPEAPITGSVRSRARTRLAFLISGRVTELPVDTGSTVSAGDLLARLEDGTRRAAVDSAAAEVALAERRLAALEAGTRPEVLERLEAEVVAWQASLDAASRTAERNRGLRAEDYVSIDRIDALDEAVLVADARLAAANAALAEGRAGTREVDLAVARAEIAVRRADLAAAEVELAKTELRAPFDGTLVERFVSLGTAVDASRDVFELLDTRHLEIEFEIPGAAARRLGPGAGVTLALDGERSFALETDLDVVLDAADPQSGNVLALARIEPGEDPSGLLQPGVFVRARLALGLLSGVSTVPSDALRITPNGPIVVLAEPLEGAHAPLQAAWLPVVELGRSGERCAVASDDPTRPLERGQQVVVTGVDLAFPGVPLNVREVPRGPTEGSR